MSFYGFDNQDDFIEYKLLNESDDNTDASQSNVNRQQTSSEHRTGGYRSRSKSASAPLTPEEEKEKRMNEEQARLERKLQEKKTIDEKVLSLWIQLVFFVALCTGIAVGYYWEDYSLSVKQALHLRFLRPESDYDDYVRMYEQENEVEESEDMVEAVPAEVQPNYSNSPQIQTGTGGSHSYSDSRYHSSGWEDEDDEEDDDDDDDTWYRGDDDPDEYWEYDYHE